MLRLPVLDSLRPLQQYDRNRKPYFGPPGILPSSPRRECGSIYPVQQQQDIFKVRMNLGYFKPENMAVKAVDDQNGKYVIIEGKLSDKDGFITKEYMLRHPIPGGVDLDDLMANISSSGVLAVTAPKKASSGPNKRRASPSPNRYTKASNAPKRYS